MVTYTRFAGNNNPNNESSATTAPTTSFIASRSRGALPWDAEGVKLGGNAIQFAGAILNSMQETPTYKPSTRASI